MPNVPLAHSHSHITCWQSSIGSMCINDRLLYGYEWNYYLSIISELSLSCCSQQRLSLSLECKWILLSFPWHLEWTSFWNLERTSFQHLEWILLANVPYKPTTLNLWKAFQSLRREKNVPFFIMPLNYISRHNAPISWLFSICWALTVLIFELLSALLPAKFRKSIFSKRHLFVSVSELDYGVFASISTQCLTLHIHTDRTDWTSTLIGLTERAVPIILNATVDHPMHVH